MSIFELYSRALNIKDAAFYPVIDTTLVLTAVTTAVRCVSSKKINTCYLPSPLSQCCYAMLLSLSIILCSGWTNIHFPVAVALSSLLTLHPSGYYPFQLTNHLGMYRSLNGHIGGDIWHQLFYASMHAYLLITHLDAFGKGVLNEMKRIVFYTQERRLVSINQERGIVLEDFDELPEHIRLDSALKRLTYDVNESFFLLRAIFRFTWRTMLPIHILNSLLNIATVGLSILDIRVLYFVDVPSDYSWYEGYIYVILVFFGNILTNQFGRIKSYSRVEAMCVNSALETEMLRLSLVNPTFRSKNLHRDTGNSIFVLLYDIRKVQLIIPELVNCIATAVLIYKFIGWAVLVPFVIYFEHHALSNVLEKFFDSNHQWETDAGDDSYKVNVMEMHRNIRSIKMFGWKKMYTDPELQNRRNKLNIKRKTSWYTLICKCVWFMYHIVDIAGFQLAVYATLYVATSTRYGSSTAISNAQMFQLDILINKMIEYTRSVHVRMKRVSSIFTFNRDLEIALKKDVTSTLPRFSLEASENGDNALNATQPSVVLENCDFSLVKDKTALANVSFSAKDGELVAVAGRTGTGKSSLLLSICGEVEKTKGTGSVHGTITFMEQKPWILNDTIRNNILFGRKYDKEYYNQVIEACALTEDIENWTRGDNTLIGENGINVSGGQRTRLSLARTVYSKADIYVLDDPLSSVDAHVKRHILENVIMNSGLLGGKIRIIAVNDEKLFPYFHQVIRLEQGKALVTKQTPRGYQTFAINSHKEETNEENNDFNASESQCSTEDIEGASQLSDKEDYGSDYGSDSDSDEEFKLNVNSAIDTREWNRWDNIRYALSICGLPALITLMLSGFVGPVFDFIIGGYKINTLQSNVDKDSTNSSAVLKYLQMSMLERAINTVLSSVRNYVKSAVANTGLEAKISRIFIANLIHAPMSFFDSTTGAGLSSTFSESVDSVSSGIPNFILSGLSQALNVMLALYRVARVAPLMLLAIPVFIWYGTRHKKYVAPVTKAISQIKRNALRHYDRVMDVISEGPMLIRLLNVGPHFTRQFIKEIDIKNRIEQTEYTIASFSAVIGQAVTWFTESVLQICMLAQNQLYGHVIHSQELVTYTGLAQTMIDNAFSVIELPERLFSFNDNINTFRHFISMKHDDDDTDKGTAIEQPPASWPSSGKIEFCNFSMKYNDDLEYALKNISLTISPGDKVGIVGRTGAGKTSLTRALFRLVSKKTCEGSILIDGHDIATVSTSNLRPRLGTILQESTVFEGSFKRNLDPLMEHTIEDMWAALIKCNMNEFVEPKRDRTKKRETIIYSDYEMTVMRDIDIWDREWKESGWMKRIFLWMFIHKPMLSSQLDTEETHGLDKNIDHISHLSDGQKQLFSLCRLLMRKYKIIVLDEATADVDLETDKEMQRLFRSKFEDCTVLTIAHRLETIMNSDKIIVMDKGRVAEFGPPKELITQGGYFSELVKANDF